MGLTRTAGLCLLLAPAAAFAQASGADRSPDAAVRLNPSDSPPSPSYSVFDPVPDGKLRAFNPDRPNKGTGPVTIDAGHFEFETDLVGVQYATSPTTSRLIYTADPVIKLGVSNRVDLELSLGGYQSLRVKNGQAGTSRISGFGDIVLKAKINVWGDDGGDTALAVIPFLKLPTAAAGLGNNQVEGGVSVPFTFSLPLQVSALALTELDVLKNGMDSGKHLGATNLLNLSRPITHAVTANLEIWTQVQAAHTSSQYTLDPALAYAIGANTQLDAGAYLGLNKAAPAKVLYLGLSERF